MARLQQWRSVRSKRLVREGMREHAVPDDGGPTVWGWFLWRSGCQSLSQVLVRGRLGEFRPPAAVVAGLYALVRTQPRERVCALRVTIPLAGGCRGVVTSQARV